MDKTYYDLERQLSLILNALKSLGFNASFSGRNDLLLEDRKFSGHAYYYRDQAALHHGTILVHSDLEKLTTYLKPSQKKITSKGVDSVRSRVANLRDLNPSITIPEVIQSLEKELINYWGSDAFIGYTTYKENNKKQLTSFYEKYASWEWRYGQSPNFDISFTERFSWGEIELGLSLHHGVIKECVIYSDAMDEDLIREIAQKLTGIQLNKQEMVNQIQGLRTNYQKNLIIDDFLSWIQYLDI